MKKNILVLSPHTDDAELGCGASISNFVSEGHNLLWVVFSTAKESLPHDMPTDTLENEFKIVIEKLDLNIDNYLINRFEVRKLHEKRQEILEILVKIRNEFKPNLVIGPSVHDYHQDHTIVANEMIRAFKSSSSIISYELPWNHIRFDTQMFIQVSEEQIFKKIDLLQSYHSQVVKERKYFSSDFIHGLAITRGTQIGVKYAEAFEVIRLITYK